jgi:hypothetical protein
MKNFFPPRILNLLGLLALMMLIIFSFVKISSAFALLSRGF